MRESQDTTGSQGLQRPADVRVVTYLLLACGSLQLLSGFLLITGIAHPVAGETRRVLLGLAVLSTRPWFALYLLLAGSASLLCAWGIAGIHRVGWWFLLVYSIHGAVNDLLLLPEHKVTPAISMAITLTLLTWLWFRRDLYGARRGVHTEQAT